MSIKDRINQLTGSIDSAKQEEDEVVDETTSGAQNSIQQAFSDQEHVIQETATFEEELLNLLVNDSEHIMDKADEFISWEKRISTVFQQMLENGEVQQVINALNQHDWESLEEAEQVLAERVRQLEQGREEVVSDMSTGNIETIEFLLDDNEIVQDIEGLHDLIEEETEEEQIIEKKAGENDEVAEQEQELRQVRQNFQNLVQIKNRIERLKKKRKTALGNAQNTLNRFNNQVKQAKSSIPSNSAQRPHNFGLTKAVLQDLGNVSSELTKNTGNGMSRRDFMKAATVTVASLTVGQNIAKNLKKFENQMNEQVEEAEQEMRQQRKRKQASQGNQLNMNQQHGVINSEDNPFSIEYAIQNTERNDQCLELKITNNSNSSAELELLYQLPGGVNLHGGINIGSSASNIVASQAQLRPGKTSESGIFYSRTNPNAQLVTVLLQYTLDGENWYEDQLNISFTDQNIEEMVANQGVIEQQGIPVRIRWRTMRTFLEQTRFVNLELITEPTVNQKIEAEYDLKIPDNWNITGLTKFQSSQDNTANTGELNLNGRKNEDRQKFPLQPGNQRINMVNLQETGPGQDIAELDLKTSDGQTLQKRIQLI